MGLNVSLTPELEELIREKVESGHYASASEVVRAALRLFKDQEALRELHLEEVRKKVAEGLAAADRGELLDGPKTMAELKRGITKRAGPKKEG